VQIAPNSYRARKTRQPSDRSCRDEVVTEVIKGLHRQNYGVYGTRKIYEALRREGGVEGRHVARCTVERLMRGAGLRGMLRAKTPRTTRPAPRDSDTRPDLVDRCFAATAPNRLWVADITYVRTFSGWVYAAFVLDVFSRRIVGWQLSNNLRTDLALDALNMGLWLRRGECADLRQLIHHSDRGVQYVAVRYAERLAEVEVVASVGSVGDSYDNAMAEAFNSLFKAELVRNKGPWKSIDDLEIAVAAYIDWYNRRRLHGELGLVPPAEYEQHRNPANGTHRALGA
jgi:putative transposase